MIEVKFKGQYYKLGEYIPIETSPGNKEKCKILKIVCSYFKSVEKVELFLLTPDYRKVIMTL